MDRSFLKAATIAILLSACGGQPAATSDGKFGPGRNYREVTDTHTCVGDATNPTIYKTWKRSFISDSDTVDITYQILNANRTRVTQTCHFPKGPDVSAIVEVQSVVNDSNHRFAIKDTTQYTENVTSNGNKYSCTVSTQAFNVPFIFKGNCFGLVADAQVTWFLPAQ